MIFIIHVYQIVYVYVCNMSCQLCEVVCVHECTVPSNVHQCGVYMYVRTLTLSNTGTQVPQCTYHLKTKKTFVYLFLLFARLCEPPLPPADDRFLLCRTVLVQHS